MDESGNPAFSKLTLLIIRTKPCILASERIDILFTVHEGLNYEIFTIMLNIFIWFHTFSLLSPSSGIDFITSVTIWQKTVNEENYNTHHLNQTDPLLNVDI